MTPQHEDTAPPMARFPTLGEKAATRIYFAQTAAGASDYARALVPTRGEQDMRPGEYVQQARRLRTWALEVLTAAVLVERANGSTWPQIAAAFGYPGEYVQSRWEPVEKAWLAGEPVELDGITIKPLVPPPSNDSEARKAAEQLDAWCLKLSENRLTRGEAKPVSDGLLPLEDT